MNLARVLFMCASLMVLTGIGAALGSIFFVGADPQAFGLVQGIAAGAMLTMIAQTIVPDAYLGAGPVIGIATLMGFLAAIFFKTLEWTDLPSRFPRASQRSGRRGPLVGTTPISYCSA